MLTAILSNFLGIGSIVFIEHKPGGGEQKLAELLTIFSHGWEEFPLLLGLQISQIIVMLFVSEHVQTFHGSIFLSIT